ncbi:MAG: OmpA family protein [Dongiaceae bacterium]
MKRRACSRDKRTAERGNASGRALALAVFSATLGLALPAAAQEVYIDQSVLDSLGPGPAVPGTLPAGNYPSVTMYGYPYEQGGIGAAAGATYGSVYNPYGNQPARLLRYPPESYPQSTLLIRVANGVTQATAYTAPALPAAAPAAVSAPSVPAATAPTPSTTTASSAAAADLNLPDIPPPASTTSSTSTMTATTTVTAPSLPEIPPAAPAVPEAPAAASAEETAAREALAEAEAEVAEAEAAQAAAIAAAEAEAEAVSAGATAAEEEAAAEAAAASVAEAAEAEAEAEAAEAEAASLAAATDANDQAALAAAQAEEEAAAIAAVEAEEELAAEAAAAEAELAAEEEIVADEEAETQEASLPPITTADGQVSVVFATESADLPPEAEGALRELAVRMADDETLRLELLAYAAGDEDSASRARRMSLSRALAVRAFLINEGVRSTRMDVRALGNNIEGEPADRVDILPKTQ